MGILRKDMSQESIEKLYDILIHMHTLAVIMDEECVVPFNEIITHYRTEYKKELSYYKRPKYDFDCTHTNTDIFGNRMPYCYNINDIDKCHHCRSELDLTMIQDFTKLKKEIEKLIMKIVLPTRMNDNLKNEIRVLVLLLSIIQRKITKGMTKEITKEKE